MIRHNVNNNFMSGFFGKGVVRKNNYICLNLFNTPYVKHVFTNCVFIEQLPKRNFCVYCQSNLDNCIPQ